MEDDRLKRAERRRIRVSEHIFWTCEVMPSRPVAESESRVARNFCTFSGAKDVIQEPLDTTENGG